MNRSLCIAALLACSVGTAVAAPRTIKGVVVGADDKEPLPGVTVIVPSGELKRVGSSASSLGIATGLDGSFVLSIPEGVRQIRVSCVGYVEQVITLTSAQSYTINLVPSQASIGEVVVTGYQNLERRKLTASVAKLDISEGVVGAAKSIDQALAGQIAGVSVTNSTGAPGAPARIRIRGTASINGTQDPLWVLDGIPLEGTDIPKLGDNDNDINTITQSSIAGLSPSDIESITILKDAAATAIYGARAANGVIVITTKKGRAGSPVVNFSSKLSYSPKYSIDRLGLLNSSQKIDLELALQREPENAIFGAVYPKKGGVADVLTKYKLWEAYQNGGWSALSADAQSEINALRGQYTDWNDILFRNSFSQEYNVSVSGGTDKLTYYTSLAYSDENGNVRGVNLKRYNLTAKLGYQFTPKFKLGASVFLNRRNNQTFVTDKYGYSNPVYYSRTVNPYQKPYDADGNYIYDYSISGGTEVDMTRGFNIFQERAGTSFGTITTGLNTIFDAELKLTKYFKLSSQLGLQWEQAKLEEYMGSETFSMRDLRQSSSYYKSGTKSFLIPEGGRNRVNNRVLGQITWKGIAEYSQKFGSSHELQLMAGSEVRRNRYDATTAYAYGYNPRTLTTAGILYRDQNDATKYPTYVETLTRNAFASFFANGSYTYDNRYTIGGSVRLDGSDLFGVDKKYRYLPIYSVSGLWRASRERFLRDVKWLDNLSLRLSYGLQGNIDKNTSPYLVGYYKSIGILPSTTEESIIIEGAPNAKLRWEKTASYNAGIDFSILDSRINLSVDYYMRRGSDLIATQLLPLENGFRSMTINWAKMDNQGIEVNLQTRNITTKDFSWYTTLNFAYNQNKVKRVVVPSNQTTPSIEGYPVGAIFAIPTAGIDPQTGRILVSNADGSSSTLEEKYQLKDESGIGFYSTDITPAEERSFYRYIGSSDTPFTGGIVNTFSYKGWELGVNISYFLGGYVRTSPPYQVADFHPERNTSREILDRWTDANTQGRYPALVSANYQAADYSLLNNKPSVYRDLDMWVRRLSYFRLQSLRLSYTLPTTWISSWGLKGASVALEGRNLLVWGASYSGFLDPEAQSNLYATPIPKTVSFSLNITL